MGNIVWLASYPKSGNTWLRAFIYNLVENPRTPAPIARLPEWFEEESKPHWYQPYSGGRPLNALSFEELMALRSQVHRDIAGSRARGTVFVKTHNMFGQFDGVPLHNTQVMAAAVYIVRNPLDVVLSVADHFGLNIDEAIEFLGDEGTATPTNQENVLGYLGSWSTHVASWTRESHPSILVLRYEDMLDTPARTFGKVAKLLGMGEDHDRVKRAIRFSSFRELKQQEMATGFIERSPNSRSFFRKGTKNQWAQALEEAQLDRLVERHREQMARFGYLPPKFR